MPHLDGYQATAELRHLEDPSQHLPVIAMTAHATAGDRQRQLDAGMDDHITKPLRHTELADTLHRWIPTTTHPRKVTPTRPNFRTRSRSIR